MTTSRTSTGAFVIQLDGRRRMIQLLRPCGPESEFEGQELNLLICSKDDLTLLYRENELVRECRQAGEDCPICLTSLDDGCSRTPCLHVFHHKCLDAYFMASRREAGSQGARGKCPICRGAVHAPLPVKARATSGRCIIAGLTARRIPHFSNSDPPWQAD